MTKTVIGTYSRMESAIEIVDKLVNAGFKRDMISIVAHDPDERYAAYVDHDGNMDDTAKGAGIGAAIGGLGGLLLGLGALAIPGIGPVIAAGPLAAALLGAGVGAATGGIIGALIDLGVPEESAHVYAEGVRRGNVLVVAQVADSRVDEATRIMRHADLIDMEREAEGWRASGWQRFDVGGSSGTSTVARSGTAQRTDGSARRTDLDDETIEVVEENIQVGKRTTESGGVRVSTHMREVPVEEEVRLRQEHVEVERRPVNRPATEADLQGFREESFEVRETHEEAVVGKEARVVEEIHVHKDVEERTERIHDTVRRTEVDIQPLGNMSRGDISADRTYARYDPDFRTNFQSKYANSGSYDRYQPAYYYGYSLASSDRYQGRNWRDVEPEARKAWNNQNQNTWEDFKDAVQYGWDKVRGKA
jgi:uncharacterized protein (TIGR02271 family)